jgi:predicted RNA-binding Zn ribbon-like protein
MPFTSENSPAARPDFVFIGEHPAVDFANTLVVDHDAPRDLLASWPDVVAWLSQAGLTAGIDLTLTPAAETRGLKSVVEFRAAWEKVLAALVSGGKVSDAFLERLNGHLAPGTFHEIVRRHGKKEFHVSRSTPDLHGDKLALYLIARQVADFLATAHLPYLHRCANTASCVLYFYDTTKNHRRQWCSVATCGNRHKVAQFRQRQARIGK